MSVRHEVLFVVATRIKFMCPMNYATFPFDRQTCKFQVRKRGILVWSFVGFPYEVLG